MIGKHKMVTVTTRIDPDELQKLKQLASECGIRVCGYLRDLIRLEMTRANRPEVLKHPVPAELRRFDNVGQI